ncbi:methyl-CpG-binding domain-containing protein 4 [Hirsutella rhossiliensis]|uniref:Methyl-CpG-binding domain-containing protein 4 n=1 Tax=Hirsutella rhossiliensis TaxID=111463 RepID=A0A9P8MS38_9HYPO|nr:methyl-CpG-binding domain-containing protein 4 [Hirsutella rhossiliensis]KAH0960923.1 methyl-CpG-binding domain-containing protein 4 [Hirsutella rhossiliensis]
MTASFGEDVLCVFDVWEDSRDFLCDVIQSRTAPRLETQRLLHQSLSAGAEDWHALIDCATSIHQSRPFQLHGLDGQDVLTSLWLILSGLSNGNAVPAEEPWQETDSLIALAQKLERDASALLSSASAHYAHNGDIKPQSVQPKKRQQSAGATSHYWDHARRKLGAGGSMRGSPESSSSQPQSTSPQQAEERTSRNFHSSSQGLALWPSRSTSSPYFSAQSPSQGKSSPKRPPPGTVPCVPFPPLPCLHFGIIQEEVAHEPFWLLIAVTFLIKTSGQLAIPAFRRVKERFPTPWQLADPANAQELSDMIRHLGLVVVRVAYIQKYATVYLGNPPRPDVRYRVRNYDKRDVAPSLVADDVEDPEAWEIGHMTRGKYTLDSWRIFCRDQLLGRAQDWNGKGREPEFQPEWMRVMPQDKELRAFLRWMWMREGWEWDPATGERTVLREEMRRAVDQGRVEYDDAGGLRILDEPPKPPRMPG